MDLIRLPPDRFANVVLAWALDRVDPEKREEWLIEMAAPLPWDDADSEVAVEMESASFFAMMGKGK